MSLRPASTSDIRGLAELWDRAFPGERTVGDRVRQLEAGLPHGGVEIVHVWEEHGAIAGAFKALRLRQVFSGAALPTLGLAAVAVAPERRRQGLGVHICREAIRIGRERGDVMSTLYPFRPAFYRSLGWGLAGRLHSHLFDPSWLTGHAGREQVRPARADELPAVAACYDEVATASNGMLLRHEALWRQLGDNRSHVFVHPADHGVGGYLVARFGGGTRPDLRVLRIEELVAAGEDSYRALLGWIGSMSDQWRRVRYDAGVAERFEHRMAEPRPPGFARARTLYFPVARIIAGPMVRVLDVAAALDARARAAPAAARGAQIDVEVRDDVLPENRGPWRWTVGGGVRPAEPGEFEHGAGADAAVRTDAATFAQIYAGELAPSEAGMLRLAQSHGDPLILDLAFRPSAPFRLLDEF
jgi:predicted acetyltransferase